MRLELLERLCYRLADRIVIVPPQADRRVREMGTDPRRCVHVPNASELDASVSAPIPDTLEAIFAACGSREILMYAGAQGVSNGLEVVLDALDHLRSTDPVTYERLAVVLIGDGGRHDELVREATERGHPQLHFHPPIDKAAVPGALARATLLLVAFADADVYRYGLSPNKLFDYLAAGRPVLLASRLDDTPVSEADAGRCYEPGSGRSLAEGIAALLALPPRRAGAHGPPRPGARPAPVHHRRDRRPARVRAPRARRNERMTGRVVLFGGGGFIGSALVAGLGRGVTAPSRSEVDLIDGDRLRAFLQPGDLIVNATGYAMATDRSAAGLARFRRDNVEAVRTLATAASSVGAARLLHLSSVAAMGHREGEDLREEDLAQPRTPYGQSKRDAEDAVVEAAEDVPVTILRPTSVFGEGRGLAAVLCRIAGLPVVPLPAGGSALIPFSYVGNLVAAVGLALDRPETAGRTFIVGDDRSYRLREVLLDPGAGARTRQTDDAPGPQARGPGHGRRGDRREPGGGPDAAARSGAHRDADELRLVLDPRVPRGDGVRAALHHGRGHGPHRRVASRGAAAVTDQLLIALLAAGLAATIVTRAGRTTRAAAKPARHPERPELP